MNMGSKGSNEVYRSRDDVMHVVMTEPAPNTRDRESVRLGFRSEPRHTLQFYPADAQNTHHRQQSQLFDDGPSKVVT
jgi:hypothetical protein